MDIVIVIFMFVLGCCVGSFLNVVVFRLTPAAADLTVAPGPVDYSLRVMLVSLWYDAKSLVYPPSSCPSCNTRLAVWDNIPVLSWILLKGKCRYCKMPISMQYPILEALVGVMFVGLYVLLFWLGFGPPAPGIHAVNRFGETVIVPGGLSLARDWPIFALYLVMACGLLAASISDARTMMIPLSIPWFIALVGVVAHAFISWPGTTTPGNILISGRIMLMTLAFLVGWVIAMALLQWNIIPRSFAAGEPTLPGVMEGANYSPVQIAREMGRESLFLALPLIASGVAGWLAMTVPSVATGGDALAQTPYLAGALSALFGGTVGGLLVWITRILGSVAFGKEAMGLGDVHLHFAIGTVLGAWGATIAFFLAPVSGLFIAIYMLVSTNRRHLSFGPYLSAGAIATVILFSYVMAWLEPGIQGLLILVRGL